MGQCLSFKIDLTDAERLAEVEKLYNMSRASTFPKVPEMLIEDLQRHLQAKESTLVIVDCRTESERSVSVIPGSISEAMYEKRRKDFAKWTVVVYCTAGVRSGLWAKRALKKRKNVLPLRCGILGWIHAGNRIVDKNGRDTNRVHVFSRKFDYAPSKYETVM